MDLFAKIIIMSIGVVSLLTVIVAQLITDYHDSH